MRTAIVIGAGVTGLTVAYELIKQGLRVTVLEASERIGGLASSLAIDGKPVEKYYHFICKGDEDLVAFIGELGLADRLHWREGLTGCCVDGKIYSFNTPVDLLKFRPIPLTDRLRFGLHVVISQHRNNWQPLDKVSAKKWLTERIGTKAYHAVWDPLLRIKFGKFHDQISAAWVWHRIQRVAKSRKAMFGANVYGFVDQGCHVLLEDLANFLQQSDLFSLETATTVRKIKIGEDRVLGVVAGEDHRFIPSDYVISTVAIPSFLKIAPSMGDFTDNLASIEYLNIACFVCQLDRAFSENFWLNVNDPALPINGIIEMTNLNPRKDLSGAHLIYIPFYLHNSDVRWNSTDQEFYEECIASLKAVRSDFSEKWIANWWVFRDSSAQAICRTGFLDLMPGYETPITGLYITDSIHYYPEDRTINASVRMGKQVAALVSGNDPGNG